MLYFQADRPTCRDDFRPDFWTQYKPLFSHVPVKHSSHHKLLSLCVQLRTRWMCMVGITIRPLCFRRTVPDSHRIGGWVGPRDALHLLDKKGTHSSAEKRITNRPLSRKVCFDLPYSVITCRAELPIGCGLPFAVPTRSFSVLYLNLFIHVLCD